MEPDGERKGKKGVKRVKIDIGKVRRERERRKEEEEIECERVEKCRM